ncbi:hypothetical protein GTW41_24390 [Streptomyces sp. SID4941]|nr:hypothetical protein [Streptomyces sp. SID4941]
MGAIEFRASLLGPSGPDGRNAVGAHRRTLGLAPYGHGSSAVKSERHRRVATACSEEILRSPSKG